MKQHLGRSMHWRIFGISLVLALTCACATIPLPTGSEYDPPSGRGPIVILISGHSGPKGYSTYAAEVASLGYYAVLLDGNDFNRQYAKSSADDLRRVIERAQSSPKALPGKAAVIGFSRGGGGALMYAAGMPDLVSAIVAYYPGIGQHVSYMRSFVAQFRVPILVLAGEKDTYHNCCLIESMRAMEAAAKEGGKPFELVVYSNANHGFNLRGRNYRNEDSADAWQRTTKMLSQYQPLR
jgi:carboxymethylenebutenolidase